MFSTRSYFIFSLILFPKKSGIISQTGTIDIFLFTNIGNGGDFENCCQRLSSLHGLDLSFFMHLQNLSLSSLRNTTCNFSMLCSSVASFFYLLFLGFICIMSWWCKIELLLIYTRYVVFSILWSSNWTFCFSLSFPLSNLKTSSLRNFIIIMEIKVKYIEIRDSIPVWQLLQCARKWSVPPVCWSI